jgi:hypothetical protein
MRNIGAFVVAVVLGGCATGTTAMPQASHAPEPVAIAVPEPALPLAAQASWTAGGAAADVAAEIEQALAADPSAADAGIAALRQRGQDGLDALLATLGERAATDEAARAVVTRVAAQLDAHASGLFWYTDRDAALARARAENKPVLSLRLLGRLDEELSCANSRFFRTAVYPNAEVADYLRRSFVLHWSSERPAPRITIDFGNGRKLERTITGNSIHYVLDSSGMVLDALPGLYGARAFIDALEPSRVRGSMPVDAQNLASIMREWHAAENLALLGRWRDELAVFGLAPVPAIVNGGTPSAATAAPIAVAKMAVEAPMVAASLPSADELAARTDDAAWQKLAVRALDRARLDGVSRALIRSKRPMAPTSDGARPIAGSELDRVFLALELRIAEDTVKNELGLHRRVHEWLAVDSPDFGALNERVYAELFLTPRSDPWLGLMPADTFTGLTNDGVEIGRR